MPQQIDNEIGNRLKLLKSFLGYNSLLDFSQALKVDQSQFSKILNGKLNLTIEMCKELYSSHNVNLNWLMTGIGEPVNKKNEESTYTIFEGKNKLILLDEPESMLNESNKFLNKSTIANAVVQRLSDVETTLDAIREFVTEDLVSSKKMTRQEARAALGNIIVRKQKALLETLDKKAGGNIPGK